MRFLYVILAPVAMIAVICIAVVVLVIDIMLGAIGVGFIPTDTVNILFGHDYDRWMPDIENNRK